MLRAWSQSRRPRARSPRARCRGTALFHVQVLVDCAAVNMKRLAEHAGEAAEGRAAAPSGAEVAQIDAQRVCAASERFVGAALPGHLRTAGLSTEGSDSAWSFAVSLN